ncbi:hypothetical protein D3C78_922530 [compost metagenome]
MGNDDDGAAFGVQFVENTQNLIAAGAIQRAGRLVRKNDLGIVHQSAGDGNTLLLAAGKLAGTVIDAFRHTETAKQPRGIAPAIALCLSGIDRRNFNITERRQLGKQMVTLEDKTEIFAPQRRKLVGIKITRFLPPDAVDARCRPVEAAEDVHQRRLARTGCADNRHHLTGLDGEVDVLQHADRAFAGWIIPPHGFKRNQRFSHGQNPIGGPPGPGMALAVVSIESSPVTTRSFSARPERTSAVTLLFNPIFTLRSEILPSAPATRTA